MLVTSLASLEEICITTKVGDVSFLSKNNAWLIVDRRPVLTTESEGWLPYVLSSSA